MVSQPPPISALKAYIAFPTASINVRINIAFFKPILCNTKLITNGKIELGAFPTMNIKLYLNYADFFKSKLSLSL